MGIAIYNFRYRDWGIALLPKGYKMGPRVPEFANLVWIIAGKVHWFCDDHEYALEPNCVTILPPRTKESYVWDQEKETVHGYISLHNHPFPQTKSEKDGLFNFSCLPRVRYLSPNNYIIAILEHLLWVLNTRPSNWKDYADYSTSYLLRIYAEDAYHTHPLPDPGLLPLILRRIIDYIKKKWVPDFLPSISIGEMMNAGNVSKAHLVRLFKQYFGAPPYACIMACRLSYAAKLLLRTDLPVDEIAGIAGFNTQFHFCREFKKSYLASPSCYRKGCAPVMFPRGRDLKDPRPDGVDIISRMDTSAKRKGGKYYSLESLIWGDHTARAAFIGH